MTAGEFRARALRAARGAGPAGHPARSPDTTLQSLKAMEAPLQVLRGVEAQRLAQPLLEAIMHAWEGRT